MTRRVREALAAAVAKIDGPVAVAVSGGIDSSALALVCKDMGKDARLLSFTLDGRLSSDFSAARRLADKFGFQFIPVILPSDDKTIVDDIKLLIKRWGVRKKTAVECLFPFLHVLRKMEAEGLKTLLCGNAADGHFALSKKAMIHYREPKEKFQQFRANYFANPDAAQVKTLTKIGAEKGITVLAPYFNREVFDLFKDKSWDELNKPRQKEAIRRDFPELDCLKIGKHTNLQLGDSGISEKVGEVAIRNFAPTAKSPITAYNRIAKTR